MITPLPGATPTKPGSATLPLPGIVAGRRARATASRSAPTRAAISSSRKPWPGMLRTIYGDPERYVQQYWSQIPGIYFTGDGARRDDDGYFWVMGRIDDVMNVSGHRLGTMEVESALVSHPPVAEAAVVGRPDEMKGQAHRRLRHPRVRAARRPTALKKELTRARREGDRRLRPARRHPLHRRAARRRAAARSCAACCATSPPARRRVGDTTTLEDYSVLAKLREEDE